MRIIYWYLRISLFFGLKNHVYNLSDRWGRQSKNSRRYGAAWEVQEDLIFLYEYPACPYCYWAVKTRDEHIIAGEYCYEEANRDYQPFRTGQSIDL